MSKIAARKASLEPTEHQPQLYFDAKRDMNPYWQSSLFSEVYLKNDVPREYKKIWEHDEIADETSGFFKFYDGFLDLVNKLENSSFESWKEAETVKNWIVPIMVLLGWDTDSKTEDSYYIDNESFTLTEKDKKQTYRPDLLYFDRPKHKGYTQTQNDAEKKVAEARDKKTGVKIVLEAKYWNRLAQKQTDSKKDKKIDDSAVGLGPELQTLKYMEILNLDFGILTDGKTWRLFHKDLSQGVDRRSYSFDLERLRDVALDITTHGNEEKYKHYAKYFYYFFAKQSFVQAESKTTPFVYDVFNYSKKYALTIEEDLKKRFIITMGITCNALMDSCKELKEEIDPTKIRNVAESHIFNVLFIKSCEVRHILPIRSVNYLTVSLHEVIESLDIMKYDPEKDEDDFLVDFKHGLTFGAKNFSYDGYQIFDRFINLYEIIHDGTAKSKDFGFEIEGFKESVFSTSEWTFAKKHKIKNREMIKILFTLNFIESSFSGRKYQQIPYSYFTPRQLGSIYESFLEYNLVEAAYDMIFHKGQWQKANIKSSQVRKLNLVDNHIVEKGKLFFSPNNEDRKMTGSYYTPDYVVKYIVENTLAPLIENRSCKEILELKVCDPAMGSGHFLAGALDFLVSVYRKKWCEENNDDMNELVEETSRMVLDSCLYGVDINSRAVKLAQMSLWLMTACAGKKLERLDDQLKCGDSIESARFDWNEEFSFLKMNNGFNAVIGNPPYVKISSLKRYDHLSNEYTSFAKSGDLYVLFIEKAFNLINGSGRIGFIVPNKFFIVDYGENLRAFLSSKSAVEKIVDFEHHQVFDGAMTYTCILSLTKTPNEKLQYYRLKNFDIETKLALGNIVAQSVKKERLDGQWCFGENKSLNLTDCVLLSDVMETMFQGLATTCDPVYILKKKNGKLFSKYLNAEVSVEKEILKPIYRGKDLGKFNLPANTEFVIFPYLVKRTGDYQPIDIDVFKRDYPRAHDYLSKCREKLDARESGKMLKKKNWHLYSQEHNLGYFESAKIITKVMSKDGSFTLDSAGESYFVGGGTAGGYGLVPKKEYAQHIDLIVAILNSKTIFTFTQKNNSVFNGGYYSYSKKTLNDIPLKIINIDKVLENKIKKVMSEIRENGYSEEKQGKLDELIESLYVTEKKLAA